MKTVLKVIGVLIVIIAIGFFSIAPTYLDKSMNKTIRSEPFEKSQWYDSIPFIADLHCDELLWDRNLLKEVNYGHVDLPRMQQSNMALQVFGIVSKVPKGLNYAQNDGSSDQVALLSFAQLRPPSSWFSIKKRALNQCASLHDFAEDSKGEFRVIASKSELSKFITDRKLNRSLVAGMLGVEGAQALDSHASGKNW
jgi:hypothetical protein